MSLAIIRTAHDHTRSVFALWGGKPWEAPLEDLPELGLSVRAAHACKRLGVRFWRDLANVTPADLFILKGVGETTFNEIREQAALRGVTLGSAKP